MSDRSTLLPTWAALRNHATSLRRVIRANRCTETSPPERDDRGEMIDLGIGRCTEEHPDAPGEWCDNCDRRATARAELAAVKKDIRATERKMLRAAAKEEADADPSK